MVQLTAPRPPAALGGAPCKASESLSGRHPGSVLVAGGAPRPSCSWVQPQDTCILQPTRLRGAWLPATRVGAAYSGLEVGPLHCLCREEAGFFLFHMIPPLRQGLAWCLAPPEHLKFSTRLGRSWKRGKEKQDLPHLGVQGWEIAVPTQSMQLMARCSSPGCSQEISWAL